MSDKQTIPEAAVEAALNASRTFKHQRGMDNAANHMRHILEAAAPHMHGHTSNERDELVELIQDVGEYIPGSHADDYISPTKAADAILAAGWHK